MGTISSREEEEEKKWQKLFVPTSSHGIEIAIKTKVRNCIAKLKYILKHGTLLIKIARIPQDAMQEVNKTCIG